MTPAAKALAAALVLLAAAMAPRDAPADEGEAAVRELLARVNAERHRAGVPSLRWDDRLAVAAEASARAIASDNARAAALDDLGSRLGRVGYVFLGVAEISVSGTAAARETAGFILADRDRRQALLDRRHEDIGIGFARRPASLQLRLLHEDHWSILLARKAPELPALSETRAAMLRAVNAHRARHKLSTLRLDARLNEAAQAHSADMAARRRMAHQGSDGGQVDARIERTGYAYGLAAENVAQNSYLAEDTVADWVSSPGHNENMLRPEIEDIGVGVFERFDTDATVQRYWTLVLARPLRIVPARPSLRTQ
ncbi:MAG: CAP domain-containing protein [Alphaproteobacteria bacterium]|nr:CAP domain-containing protein [Alphaproteobacteria bacterium]